VVNLLLVAERERGLRTENDRCDGIYEHLLLHVARVGRSAILQLHAPPRAPLVPDESPSAPSGHMACAAARARPNHQRRMGKLGNPQHRSLNRSFLQLPTTSAHGQECVMLMRWWILWLIMPLSELSYT
jgi:hypothetical protein